MKLRFFALFFFVLFGFLPLFDAAGQSPAPSSADAIFESRILPIFNSPNPSSCVQCHLRGVDLKNYILPDAKQTFANLRDQGLIDLQKPGESRILKFIAMTPNETTNLGPDIDPKLRQGELTAFRSWILAAAKDDAFRSAPKLEPAQVARPKVPDEVIAHSRSASLLDSYRRNIWALRFRCANCHMPGGQKFEKHAKEHGRDVMAWLKAEGPAESMRYLMASDLLDLENPAESELLLKPLDVSDHGGGEKMRMNDTDYVAYLTWIQDYAKIAAGGYATAADLPTDRRRVGTEIWVRATDLPAEWVGKTGFIAVHGVQPGRDAFEETPRAITSGSVIRHPRFRVFFQGFLMVEPKTDRPLPPGAYQLRFYLDEGERKIAGWDEAVKEARQIGTMNVRAQWRRGFKAVTVVRGSGFQ